MSTPNQRAVRLIQHDESFEVRVSTFVYFDDVAGRRAITGRPTREQALQKATEIARQERGDGQ